MNARKNCTSSHSHQLHCRCTSPSWGKHSRNGWDGKCSFAFLLVALAHTHRQLLLSKPDLTKPVWPASSDSIKSVPSPGKTRSKRKTVSGTAPLFSSPFVLCWFLPYEREGQKASAGTHGAESAATRWLAPPPHIDTYIISTFFPQGHANYGYGLCCAITVNFLATIAYRQKDHLVCHGYAMWLAPAVHRSTTQHRANTPDDSLIVLPVSIHPSLGIAARFDLAFSCPFASPCISSPLSSPCPAEAIPTSGTRNRLEKNRQR